MNVLGRNMILVLLLLVVAGTASAAVFIKGKVTRPPWKERQYHIAVDNVEYTIMPDVKIMLKGTRGNHPARTAGHQQLQRLGAGMTVWISVEGNRIYQIWQAK